MQTSYEMAFNVLGCGLNDPEYDVFLKHFGIAEEEVDVSQIMRFYGLPRRGLSLLYSRTSSCFWFVSFSFYTRSIADGLANPFDGAVYANIKGTDTPQEVMKKLG